MFWGETLNVNENPTENLFNIKTEVVWLSRRFMLVFLFFPAGFAWILPGRPANGFPSTGQTLVWRKLRLLHIEGVSEWLSGHNQYLNSYTNPHAPHPPPIPLPPPSCCPPRTSLLLCPNHTHAALLCSCRCVVPTQTHLDRSTCRTKTKMKWNDTKRITKCYFTSD